MLVGAVEFADDDARQAVLTFEPRHVILEHRDLEDETAGLVRHDLLPIVFARFLHRRFDDAKILSTIRVGGDDEAAGVVLYGVLVPLAPRRDEARRRRRDIGIYEVDFAGVVVVDVDQHELLRLRR